jgi:peptide-methionine (S)-S-oxide reductase
MTTALMGEYTGRDARFATFAGGCFWGLELAYQREAGVLCTCVADNTAIAISPSYAEVCSEATGHTEAVLLLYDQSLVSCAALVVAVAVAVD